MKRRDCEMCSDGGYKTPATKTSSDEVPLCDRCWDLKDYAFNEDRLSVARTNGSKSERVPIALAPEERAEQENDLAQNTWWKENMDGKDGG